MRIFLTVAILLLVAVHVFGTEDGPKAAIPTTTEFYKKGSPFVIFQLHLNKGLLKYDYFNENSTVYKSYKLDYNSIGFSLGLGYQLKRFQVSLSGGLSTYHYWQAVNESTHYVSFGGALDTIYRTDQNRHVLPEKLAFAQLNLEYNIKVSRSLSLAPYVTLQGWKYLDNKFYPVYKDRQTYYEFDNNYAYGGGIILKGIVKENMAFSVKYGIIYNNFDPVGYFESFEKVNFHKSNYLMELSVGVQYNLFK